MKNINKRNSGGVHTDEYKKMMSERKKMWWREVKKDKEKYDKICGKISKNHARTQLGKKGMLSTHWKGGSYKTKRDGYVYKWAPDHPNAKRNGQGGGGYVLEHRLVMEKMIGRHLNRSEDVHHRNGVKDDNRPENLMLVTHFQHFEEHGCPKCGFKTYTH